MTLENQVCSLPLAQRLKELGVKQESAFYWIRNEAGTVTLDPDLWDAETVEQLAIDKTHEVCCSALTVAELGEMLPDEFFTAKFGDSFMYGFLPGFDYVQSKGEEYTEADARANMLIYLLENKLIGLPAA